MSTGISRRALLRGIGQSAALGTLAASLPRHLLAADAAATAPATAAAPAKTTICLSMLYPSGEGLIFDGDKFRDQHIPLLKSAYGEGMQRAELRLSPPPAEGAPPPALLAAVSIWLGDVNKFVAGANAHSREVAADMAAITQSAPMVQFDKVIASLGGERDAVAVGTSCSSMYFPVKEGATWDSKGFSATYLPQLLEAFGPTAVQRIEADEGAAGQGNAKPLMLGSVHIYIADAGTFAQVAGTDTFKQVDAEAGKYYSSPPFPSAMRVHAIG